MNYFSCSSSSGEVKRRPGDPGQTETNAAWIPAYAGMTERRFLSDSRFRLAWNETAPNSPLFMRKRNNRKKLRKYSKKGKSRE